MLLRGSGLLFGCLKVSKNKQPDDKDDEKYKMNVLSFSYSWIRCLLEMALSAENEGCLQSGELGAFVPCTMFSIKPCPG